MYKSRMKKVKALTLAIVASTLVGFACGWLVSQVQNSYKLTPSAVLVNDWTSAVGSLTLNMRNPELINPNKVALLIGSGLNINSIVLGRVFDDMPPSMKEQLLSSIPAAHAIATAQNGVGPDNNRRDMLIFVDCMQKVKLHGGLVRSCVDGGKK